MLLSKVCSAPAMGDYLRVKTNIARELDSHLFPILDELSASEITLDSARREVLGLKIWAVKAAIENCGKSSSKKLKLQSSYEKAMRKVYKSSFPDSPVQFDLFLDDTGTSYKGALKINDLGQTSGEIGTAFSKALLGFDDDKHVCELGCALFVMKYSVALEYLNKKWVL